MDVPLWSYVSPPHHPRHPLAAGDEGDLDPRRRIAPACCRAARMGALGTFLVPLADRSPAVGRRPGLLVSLLRAGRSPGPCTPDAMSDLLALRQDLAQRQAGKCSLLARRAGVASGITCRAWCSPALPSQTHPAPSLARELLPRKGPSTLETLGLAARPL